MHVDFPFLARFNAILVSSIDKEPFKKLYHTLSSIIAFSLWVSSLFVHSLCICLHNFQVRYKICFEIDQDHNTRHRVDPNIPVTNSELLRSMFYRGPLVWMNLPDHLRTTASEPTFTAEKLPQRCE